MENKKYSNYISSLLELYECSKKDIAYSLEEYIDCGIVIKGEYGNYTVSECKENSHLNTRFFNTPNEVVYDVMRRLDVNMPDNKFYELRDKFLELNKDLIEELLEDEVSFKKETKIRNDSYSNSENLYYDITMLNIYNYLNDNIKYGDKKQFLSNIIYSLYILKPKKTLEEELVKTLERKFTN